MHLAVIGGGPSGLHAAETAIQRGAHVTVFEAQPSVGRKLLVAGKGGLNLTKAEPLEAFAQNYLCEGHPKDFWISALRRFDPDALRLWAAQLGIETFAASTRRVYPVQMKAAPLLRRWVQRLRNLGVRFCTRHRWTAIEPAGEEWTLRFQVHPDTLQVRAAAVILALGGASWPETGSDGAWPDLLNPHTVACTPWRPANCGWEIDWPESLLVFEGHPLKNVSATAGSESARGELMVTRHGLEGGLLYQLGPALHALQSPLLHLNLKPDLTPERLLAKLGPVRKNLLREASQRWRLPPVAQSLLAWKEPAGGFPSPVALVQTLQSLPLTLKRPRPLSEAISSAGGLCWKELLPDLMLRKLPGVFAAGEMIDWEAPTGGYLLQGCFATGVLAAESALRWMDRGSGRIAE
jgi:uncharacterized flavoprotein (TIGR03862 family)